jgi:hypothetical protein
MYECVYTVTNNTADMLVAFNFQNIASPLEGLQVADIAAETSHEFYGNDFRFEKIFENMRARCDFLGLEYGSNGLHLDIRTSPPTEIEE